MGHTYLERGTNSQVVAWSVREIKEHVRAHNFVPQDILPWAGTKRKLVISRDHKDDVLIESFVAGKTGQLNIGDVIIIMEHGEIDVLSGYAFMQRFVMTEEPKDEPETSAYSMVLPFVTVASKNGPHEDQAYTAGWEMGVLYEKLRTTPHEMQIITILTENLPQADLILMKYGYTSEKIQQEPDVPEWTRLVLIPKQESDEADG